MHYTSRNPATPSGGRTAYERERGALERPRASRYVRPVQLPALQLQARDRQILAAVYEHRYLAEGHVRLLFFAGRSCQAVQHRLRALWAHVFLDRHYLPFVPGIGPPAAGRPLYMLARPGAVLVAEDLGLDLAAIPHTPAANARGFATLAHHLVVTDFLVALTAACRGNPGAGLYSIDREHTLRQRLAQARARGAGEGIPVPDGAFTLAYPEGARVTFYLEVVRSDVKGGNRTLTERFRQYASANRSGVFARVYGHERLRAVLFLTTSDQRAQHFRELAGALGVGPGLLWFGSYEAPGEGGRRLSTLTPETILGRRWVGADGTLQSLYPRLLGAHLSSHV